VSPTEKIISRGKYGGALDLQLSFYAEQRKSFSNGFT
jgi:hypothetical protein